MTAETTAIRAKSIPLIVTVVVEVSYDLSSTGVLDGSRCRVDYMYIVYHAPLGAQLIRNSGRSAVGGGN